MLGPPLVVVIIMVTKTAKKTKSAQQKGSRYQRAYSLAVNTLIK